MFQNIIDLFLFVDLNNLISILLKNELMGNDTNFHGRISKKYESLPEKKAVPRTGTWRLQKKT